MSIQKEENTTGSKYHVPNLERALEVFELLAKQSEGMSQTEIAETLQLPRNSIFRITMTLADCGYLYRDQMTKKFSLTPKLLKIGYAAIGEANLVEKSIDVMKTLRDDIDETIMLGTFLHDEGIVLEVITGGGLPFKLSVDPGSRFSLYCSAPGKSMLANLPVEERMEILKRIKYRKHTDNTLLSAKALNEHLKEWHRKGYYIDNEEEYRGLRCVGAVIRNRSGYPVSALWTAGPLDRFRMRSIPHIGRKLKEAADTISHRLGYLSS